MLTSGSVERRIDLDEADWQTATWRPRQPLSRPAPREFNLQECVARLSRVTTTRQGWEWQWNKAGLESSMQRAEASFWLTAMARADRNVKPAALAAQLAQEPPPTDLSLEDCRQLYQEAVASRMAGVENCLVLSNLLDLQQVFEILFEAATSPGANWTLQTEELAGFRQHVLPYALPHEVEHLKDRLLASLDLGTWPVDPYKRPPLSFHVAAMVGASDPLGRLVQGWPDDRYVKPGWDHTYYHQPQIVVLGLGNSESIVAEMRRLRLPLNQPSYMRGWLATTEYAGLDYARDCILAIAKREACEEMLDILARVKAPEVAPHMLELKLSSRAPRVARQWLEDNVACAIAGLLGTASGRGRLADAAIDFLRDTRNRGHERLLRELHGERAGDRVSREVLECQSRTFPPFDADSTPAWLVGNPEKPPRLPSWCRLDDLPPVVVGECCLNPHQVAWVLGTLQGPAFGAGRPPLVDLRRHATGESLDAFAWRLFEKWLAEGAPPRDKWAMVAVGLLGNDATALRLTPMIRRWPGESQHQRAVLGLECLRDIGTETALMCLNGIAQKVEFKALKARALEAMESIAVQRRMTRAELEDRVVPDCGLDGEGSRIFDFGDRQFRFLLGADLKPMVRGGDGKARPDLPAPGPRDDAEKARTAVQEWKLLKKTVREVARTQAERLEQAMVTGRRWKRAEFQTLLLQHPLLIHLVRRALWGGYDAAGRLTATFRVAEDRTLSDEHDAELSLDAISEVGLVHPMHLSLELKRAWGQIFSDYQIITPFAQLGREVYSLEQDEKERTDITRFAHLKIPATALVGTLERLGWARGIPQDAGFFYEHSKPFYGANVTAIAVYDGLPVGYMQGWDDQHIQRCFLIPGIYTPKMYPDHKNAVPLGTVDTIVVSEVLKDLTLLASKAS